MNFSCIWQTCFPRSVHYRALTRPAAALVRESAAEEDHFHFSERHLQCLWFDSKLRPSTLHTGSGEPVIVEHPGQWNLEAGPDFLNAALLVGAEKRRIHGDVEIHIHPKDWQRHGHARNPRYSALAAHITYFPGTAAPLPAKTIQIAFQPALKHTPLFSFENIDLTAYPFLPFPAHNHPCAMRLAQYTQEQRMHLLESAGEERLRRKTGRMAQAIAEQGAEQALYEEMMAAMGYKPNRTAGRQLARTIPLHALREESAGRPFTAYAILAGAAGLLPEKIATSLDADARKFVRQLWDEWWKHQSPWNHVRMSRADWQLHAIRPANHPLRRLAAMADIFIGDTPVMPLLATPDKDPTKWLQRMQAHLSQPSAITFWRHRAGLGGKVHAAPVALLGPDRTAALLANVIVPWTAATGGDVSPLLPLLPPEEDNTVVRQTAQMLFGHDHNPRHYRTGLRLQGLMQIFQDFCLPARHLCADCRLAQTL